MLKQRIAPCGGAGVRSSEELNAESGINPEHDWLHPLRHAQMRNARLRAERWGRFHRSHEDRSGL
jgi:hypothetical protein